MTPPTSPIPPNAPKALSHPWRGWIVLAVALAPALVAIWTVPDFVTQDGPAHLYNAQVLVESLKPGSPFDGFYQVRWEPLPNWAGHLTLMGLVAVLPPRVADHVVLSLTLVGFAASIVWLRWRVAGEQGLPLAAVLATLLALNVTWLFGFTSFLLGACLFPITLGVWWSGRDQPGPRLAGKLAGLLILGYACHLVSLGLTVLSLVVLSLTTPGPGRARRIGWTLAALAPLVPLGLAYLSLTRRGGGFAPTWGHLTNPLSPVSWIVQFSWIDPITLGSRLLVPFGSRPRTTYILLTPALWLAAALGVLLFANLRSGSRPDDSRLGWLRLATVVLAAGVLGPDTVGAAHGDYLPQRVVLLGLVALVPGLRLDLRHPSGQLAGALLAGALAFQSAFVWDYALESQRRVSGFSAILSTVGTRQRIATLVVDDLQGRFRANPLLHADNLLGLGTGNIVWSNYETLHYYFPVQFRPGLARPPARWFEDVALLAGPSNASARFSLWNRLLSAHHSQIDTLVVWGSDPALDALNAHWFSPDPAAQSGLVRVYRRRGPLAQR